MSVADDVRDALTDDHLVATLTVDRRVSRYASMTSLHCRCFLLALVQRLRNRFQERCEYWGRIHAHGDGWFHVHAALWCPELHELLASEPEAAMAWWREACAAAGFGPASRLEFIRYPGAYAYYLAVTSAGEDRQLPWSGARSVLHSTAFFNPPVAREVGVDRRGAAGADVCLRDDKLPAGGSSVPAAEGPGPCCWAVGCSGLLLVAALVCFALAVRSCTKESSGPPGLGAGCWETRRKFAYVFSGDVLCWDSPLGRGRPWAPLRRGSRGSRGSEIGVLSWWASTRQALRGEGCRVTFGEGV